MGGFQSVGYWAPGSGGLVTGTPVRGYIQILNTGGYWVCASSIGTQRGTVRIHVSSILEPVSYCVKTNSDQLLIKNIFLATY